MFLSFCLGNHIADNFIAEIWTLCNGWIKYGYKFSLGKKLLCIFLMIYNSAITVSRIHFATCNVWSNNLNPKDSVALNFKLNVLRFLPIISWTFILAWASTTCLPSQNVLFWKNNCVYSKQCSWQSILM